jgi:hypothetical protein
MSLLSQASLVMTPNAIKESKIYSIIPTNGNGDADFTRGTLASSTLSGANGLIELVPYNLFNFSEQFDQSYWLKGASTISPNSINSPNGTLTADTFTADGTTAQHQIQSSGNSFLNGTTYTISIYCKKLTNNLIQLAGTNPIFGSNVWANFDLNNGVVGTIGSSTTANITDVGNGWYRCSIIGTAISNTTTNGIVLWIVNSLTSPRGETNALNTSVFLWGAQVVQGSVPKDYFFTTDRLNVPRLNYESYGGCPSLLLEPQRTNLLLNSVWAGGGSLPTSWVTGIQTGTSTPIASIKNPNVTAYSFVTTSAQRQWFYQGFAFTTIPTNPIICFSVYVESVTTAVAISEMLAVIPSTTGNGNTVFLKNNVTINATTNIIAGNTYSVQYTVTVSDVFRFRIGSGVSNTVAGNFVISMPQVEQGLFARTAYSTSFIPTTTGSVTRNGDVFTRNNLYANGIITDIGGTWFLEINNNLSLIRDGTLPSGISLDVNPAFFDDGFLIRNNFNGTSVRLGIEVRQGGSIVTSYSTQENTVKIGIKWTGSDFVAYVNGIAQLAGSFTPIQMNYLTAKADDVPKYIKSMMFFPLPLSNSEMVALTSSTNYISYENMAINLNYVIQ